ncbi:hypothetical protein DTY81_23755 [Escherichia coli]|nr:hypothetical protein [Escherichia coli]EAB6512794.1 hypothetical protein [Shigella flexneri]EEW8596812.1 hypothetical protein [Escherichia coli]EGD5141925.1 hypothetical protein [Escherichia coli]QGU53794.1 hypothetical protein CUC39_00590 [Shigella boydii]
MNGGWTLNYFSLIWEKDQTELHWEELITMVITNHQIANGRKVSSKQEIRVIPYYLNSMECWQQFQSTAKKLD